MLLFFLTKSDLGWPIAIGGGNKSIRMRHYTYVCCLGDLRSGTQKCFRVMDAVQLCVLCFLCFQVLCDKNQLLVFLDMYRALGEL